MDLAAIAAAAPEAAKILMEVRERGVKKSEEQTTFLLALIVGELREQTTAINDMSGRVSRLSESEKLVAEKLQILLDRDGNHY